MGKDAAERMNYRAGQLGGRVTAIRSLAPAESDDQELVKLWMNLDFELRALETIIEALRADAAEEYGSGQRWFREEMARREERREAERIQTPIEVGGE